jgi:hypothetical protein
MDQSFQLVKAQHALSYRAALPFLYKQTGFCWFCFFFFTSSTQSDFLTQRFSGASTFASQLKQKQQLKLLPWRDADTHQFIQKKVNVDEEDPEPWL